MNANDSKKAIFSRTAKGTLFGSALFVTGFAAAADLSGAAAHVAKTVDTGFAPLEGSRGLDGQRLAFGSVDNNQAAGAQELVIRDQLAFVLGNDAQERPAPDGFYRLSNNQILKVTGGKVFQQSILAMAPKGWKDWIRKSSARATGSDAAVESVYLSLVS
jgi:hypothetical protein